MKKKVLNYLISALDNNEWTNNRWTWRYVNKNLWKWNAKESIKKITTKNYETKGKPTCIWNTERIKKTEVVEVIKATDFPKFMISFLLESSVNMEHK